MRVEIVVFDGVDELDVVGPYAVLGRASRLGADLHPTLVTLAGRPPRVVARHGLALEAAGAASGAAQLLVVPGGGWADGGAEGVRAEIAAGDLPRLVSACHRSGAVVAAVGTGAMALSAAGLLAGRRATTHHSAQGDLAADGAEVVTDRVVDLGDLVTCGGGSSGLDLALHLVARFASPALAGRVAVALEHPMHPVEAADRAGEPLQLRVGSVDLGICRLDPGDPVPPWATAASWRSVTRTPDELSIVYPLAEHAAAPPAPPASGPWRSLTVAGPLAHDLVGVLARLAGPLADAAIPIFVVSTHGTDHVLVPAGSADRAVLALRSAGHRVEGDAPSSET